MPESIVNRPFDRALEYNVQTVAQLVRVEGGRVQFCLPQPAREMLQDNVPLSSGLDDEVQSEVQVHTDRMRGQVVRVAWLWVQPTLPSATPVLVQVAETR